MAAPIQLLAYSCGQSPMKGADVDQPRNLAKPVTVGLAPDAFPIGRGRWRSSRAERAPAAEPFQSASLAAPTAAQLPDEGRHLKLDLPRYARE
jgi:hypothetical protein